MITLFGVSYAWNSPEVLVVGGIAFLVLVLLILILRAAGRESAPLMRELGWLSNRVQGLSDGQERLAGGLHHVSEAQTVSQTAMLQLMEQRLAEVQRSMTEALQGTSMRTARSLGDLQMRLETIDKAQANIEKLSGNVLGLQDILSNKQTRGAFGEIQLHDIVGKALPTVSDWRYLNLNHITKAVINQDSCIQCGRCYIACEDTSHQAITASKNGKRHFEVKNDECVGCNLCVTVCPVADCITLRDLSPGEMDERTGKPVQADHGDWTSHPNNPMRADA